MDFNELAERLGLEQDEFMELIELFLETGGADLEKIQSALQQGDGEQVVQAAHSLKGASGNLGFMKIYDAAREVEEKARNDSLEGIEVAAKAISAKFEELGAEVKG